MYITSDADDCKLVLYREYSNIVLSPVSKINSTMLGERESGRERGINSFFLQVAATVSINS